MVIVLVEIVRVGSAVLKPAADENGQWKLDRQPGDENGCEDHEMRCGGRWAP
jgi:hypothetical protein